jgi:predicted nucleic acid-binding Zn ribbon protein
LGSDDETISCPECNHGRVKRLLSSTCFIGNPDGSHCSGSSSKGFS